jgi:hypothetical protein
LNKKLNKRVLKFIGLVASGETLEKSYVAICNKKTTSPNARVQGSRLSKKYAPEIAQERERIANVVTEARDSSIVREALNGILSQAEVDERLSRIISFSASDQDRLRAIDLYYKRFGSNAPAKTDITSDGKALTPPVINVIGKTDKP